MSKTELSVLVYKIILPLPNMVSISLNSTNDLPVVEASDLGDSLDPSLGLTQVLLLEGPHMDIVPKELTHLSSNTGAEVQKAPGTLQGGTELSDLRARAEGAASSQTEVLIGAIFPLFSPSSTQAAHTGRCHV